MKDKASYLQHYDSCVVCPRKCGVNRNAGERGICKAPAELYLGRAALHWWEEPCLVGDKGSGAVFFSYCPMGCVYCQNEDLVAGAGVAVGIVIAVIHGLLMADFTGALMNILCVTCFVLPAAIMYHKKRTYPVAIVGLLISVVAATLAAIVGNLILTPMWLGVPLDAVIAMIIPILIPFNLLKGIINAVLTLIIYKSISNLITPKKDQVKGR